MYSSCLSNLLVDEPSSAVSLPPQIFNKLSKARLMPFLEKLIN